MNTKSRFSFLMNAKSKTTAIHFILIIILGLAVYANSLRGEFIWDDCFLVKDNAHIKSWTGITKLFTEDVAAGANRNWNSFRPLQMLTYAFDYSIWGLNPAGYHLTSILLHILAALAIYWLIALIFDDRLLSFLTGILFVVHPVHVEAVAYISGRADSLSLLFMLLAFIFYLKALRFRSTGLTVLLLLTYILALLSRENSLILPVLILLYHCAFEKKLPVKQFLPLLSIALVYVLLRTTLLRPLLANIIYSTTLSQRLPGFFAAFITYLRLLLVPVSLHMEYGNGLFSFSDPRVIAGIFLFSSLLIFALAKRKSDRLTFFSLSWFMAALLPVSNLYPINAYLAEHWLYLPSIGFFLIPAKALSRLYRLANFKSAAIVFAVGLLAFYSYLTVKQNDYWKNPIGFYEKTLQYVPDSKRALNSLGMAYRDAYRQQEAIALFKRAIEIDPYFPDAYNNLGTIYRDLGRKQEAIILFEKAMELKPDSAELHYNLGIALHETGRDEEAIAAYQEAIKLAPDFPEAYNNLGAAYEELGRKDEAVVLYKKAIELNPEFMDAKYNLARICGESGGF